MAFPKLMAGHRIRFQQLPREQFSGTKGEKRSQQKSRQIRNFFGLALKPEATTQVESKTAPRLSSQRSMLMSQVSIWFERKFEFSFPLELYPNLCVRLRGTPARLEEIIRDCPRELLIQQPQEKWSIQEHAGHLLDLEPFPSAGRYLPYTEALWLAQASF